VPTARASGPRLPLLHYGPDAMIGVAMTLKTTAILSFVLIAASLTVLGASTNGTFSMPDSVLLFADRGHGLYVTTPSNSQFLSLPAELPTNSGVFNYPNLRADGKQVAWGFAVGDGTERRTSPRFVLGLRSVANGDWKTFGDFQDVGAAAFSPDLSRVAFVGKQYIGKSALMLLELSTGEMSSTNSVSGVPERAGLSWSPSAKQIVVEIQHGDQPSEIAVVELASRSKKTVGKGVDPVWSPTGGWIAYFDESSQKCNLVHPDGTGTKTVLDLRRIFGYRMLVYGAVWSPDGKQLLLNEMKGEGPKIDVMLLDIANGKLTRKSRNGLPVFGWVTQKH